MDAMPSDQSKVTYVTERYTYIVINGYCAEVRDASGVNVEARQVLGCRLTNGVSSVNPTRSIEIEEIREGDRLRFEANGVGWITDPILTFFPKPKRTSEPKPESRPEPKLQPAFDPPPATQRIIPRPPSTPLILEL